MTIEVDYSRDGTRHAFLSFKSKAFMKKWVEWLKKDGATIHGVRMVEDKEDNLNRSHFPDSKRRLNLRRFR